MNIIIIQRAKHFLVIVFNWFSMLLSIGKEKEILYTGGELDR